MSADLILHQIKIYLIEAGWTQWSDFWNDPHPELERVHSNTQTMCAALQMQLSRETSHIPHPDARPK